MQNSAKTPGTKHLYPIISNVVSISKDRQPRELGEASDCEIPILSFKSNLFVREMYE